MRFQTPSPLLRNDTVIVMRPQPAADAEGDTSGVDTPVGSNVRGTWRALTPNELVLAGQRGQTLHAELAVSTTTDIQPGDDVTVRGTEYIVVAVDDLRTFRRCSLRTRAQ